MKCHYLQLEKFHIPIAIRFPLHSFDFVVGTFERACRKLAENLDLASFSNSIMLPKSRTFLLDF